MDRVINFKDLQPKMTGVPQRSVEGDAGWVSPDQGSCLSDHPLSGPHPERATELTCKRLSFPPPRATYGKLCHRRINLLMPPEAA